MMINVKNTLMGIVFYCPSQHPCYQQSQSIIKDLKIQLIEDLSGLQAECSYVLFWQKASNNFNLAISDAQFIKQKKPASQLQGLYVDYINSLIAGKKTYKFTYQDALPKAMGLAKIKDQLIHILDGTAGFTLDAYALLQLNKNIKFTLVENSKILFYLVNDAIQRLKSSSDNYHQSLADRLRLYNNNFIDYLNTGDKTESYQIIYLDPMFEKSGITGATGAAGVSAKPKQNMQLLQNLCSNINEITELLSAAIDYLKIQGNGRVVVKRSSKQPKVLEKYINYSVESKQIRYDVYLV